jgi:hypothetical protein
MLRQIELHNSPGQAAMPTARSEENRTAIELPSSRKIVLRNRSALSRTNG